MRKGLALIVLAAAVSSAYAINLEPEKQPVVRERIIVRFEPGQETAARSLGSAVRFMPRPDRAPARLSAMHALAGQLAVIDVPEGEDPKAFADRLKRENSGIRYAVPDGKVQGFAIPNDANFDRQWGLHNTGQLIAGLPGVADFDMDGPEAWDIINQAPTIVVAVLDTGVDYTHVDLAANIWSNIAEIPGNGIDDDFNGYVDDVRGYDFRNSDPNPMDDNSHGTHIAGVIGAIGNNGIGVAGVAWNVKIMPLKFLDNTANNGRISDAIAGIQYAIFNGAQVINCSWGDAEPNPALEDVVNLAVNSGLVVVAAVGNNGASIPYIPATYDNVIAVAGTTNAGAVYSLSNFGAWVDVAAPARNIWSTTWTNLAPDTYAYKTGTSMACAYVSGIAAILMAHELFLTPAQIKTAIQTGVDVPDGWNSTYGTGHANLLKAIQSVPDGTNPTVVINAPTANEQVFGLVTVDVTATDDTGIDRVVFFVDGVEFATDNTAPYSAQWDAGDATEDFHLISVTAYDVGGLPGVDTVLVEVRNDSTPPTVSFESPKDGDVVSGTVTVVVNAADNRALEQVLFYVDNVLTGADGTSPFTFTWNAGTEPISRTLKAEARDLSGNSNFVEINVTVTEDNEAPTVTIIQPDDGIEIDGSITIQATASDDVRVDRVVFAVNGTTIGTDTSGPEYEIRWNVDGLDAGPYTITATALDGGGRSATDTVNVTLIEDQTPPTVQIAAPLGGALVSGEISIQASAIDNRRVVSMTIYIDGAFLATGDDDAIVSAWDTSSVQPGPRQIRVEAVDARGNTGHATISVTVADRTPDPGIDQQVNSFFPLRGETVFLTLNLAATAHVEATIYNRLGKKILDLFNGTVSPGTPIGPWDGRNEENDVVAAGVYLVRLIVDGSFQTAKFVVRK